MCLHFLDFDSSFAFDAGLGYCALAGAWNAAGFDWGLTVGRD